MFAPELWRGLVLLQHELLLFAGVFFLIGALDDLAVDGIWLWLKVSGRARTARRGREALRARPLSGPVAVLIPAWREAAVIGQTLRHLLDTWPHATLRLYIGCYRNDPATLGAAIAAARGDPRLRLVILDRDGPTTKADCLNRLHAALLLDEARSGRRFATVVFHDAEDMVDPAALGLLDECIAGGADFVQLPVEPLVPHHRDFAARHIGAHYCEEFAEAHGKAMVVRDALGAGLPGAGVGCAVSRRALDWLVRREGDGGAAGLPFASDSLTEDYELGLAVAAAGGRCRFVRARGEDGRLIATRAFFPHAFDAVVRQKARWVLGISLLGWDRVGWSGGITEFWMRARDRRGPLTALVLLVGYVLVLLTGVMGVMVVTGLSEPVPLSPVLRAVLYANAVAFGWRIVWRFAFTAREHGVAEGLFAVLRLPLANVIAIIAGRRAVFAYARTLAGRSAVWDKTDHDTHPAELGARLRGQLALAGAQRP
ncbi:glycosyl transferase family protein [Erythrobacter sp. BLCC-B19]|uniref:glycosyl transferase family protein n=1 Tax=Erythrobacter sp. BLCC-B19 TaxID=3025315 RepID=UPI0023627FD1|nr:glycosyl transferase family protein [Erythrobacter sp. BLCC-B19]WDA41624.1 glycosyl transferase family protein [Erythrobacter sp. BLCC-B19]